MTCWVLFSSIHYSNTSLMCDGLLLHFVWLNIWHRKYNYWALFCMLQFPSNQGSKIRVSRGRVRDRPTEVRPPAPIGLRGFIVSLSGGTTFYQVQTTTTRDILHALSDHFIRDTGQCDPSALDKNWLKMIQMIDFRFCSSWILLHVYRWGCSGWSDTSLHSHFESSAPARM